MSDFTPGPWRVEYGEGDESSRVYGIHAADKRLVETDSGVYYLSPADARLMAAAPQLLAAAKRALYMMKMRGAGTLAKTPAGEDLRAAIGAATGEEA